MKLSVVAKDNGDLRHQGAATQKSGIALHPICELDAICSKLLENGASHPFGWRHELSLGRQPDGVPQDRRRPGFDENAASVF